MFNLLLILVLLFSKHLAVDSFLQTSYQYLNKGNYRHFGGYLHAGLHMFSTLFIFACFTSGWVAIALALIDGTIHYVVDWCKVNVTKKYEWSSYVKDDPKPHQRIYTNWFYHALMTDQYFHSMTYILLAALYLWWV